MENILQRWIGCVSKAAVMNSRRRVEEVSEFGGKAVEMPYSWRVKVEVLVGIENFGVGVGLAA